jgi:hypothetical protein
MQARRRRPSAVSIALIPSGCRHSHSSSRSLFRLALPRPGPLARLARPQVSKTRLVDTKPPARRLALFHLVPTLAIAVEARAVLVVVVLLRRREKSD